MEVRTPPAVGFFLDHEYVSHTLRHIRILKHIEAPDRAKLNRTRPHQRRSNLTSKTRQRFQNLKQKLAKITAKLDQLEDVLQQYLKDFITHRHQIILELFQTKFARELRDEVYGYILRDQMAISINHHDLVASASPAFAIPGHTSASRSKHFQTSLERNGYGHLLEARAILKDTMLELAHAWYRLSTFRFMQAIHVDLFLRTDFHGFGLDTQKLIRSIEVCILLAIRSSQDERANKKMYSPCYDLAKLFTPVNSSGDCVKLAKDLAELHTLKTGANILLSLQALPTVAVMNVVADPSAAVPPRYLALLFPSIQKLLTAEYRVTVKLGYHLKFKVVSEELKEECWAENLEKHYKAMLAKRARRE